jgi:dGTPase
MNPKLISDILAHNKKREEMTLSGEACPSSRGTRNQAEKQTHPDIRSSFSRDTDRIIHSRAYTRYIDKTQVFYLFQNDHITHRVLHVQLVSKIARMIGRALRLNEDLIEAIALGHDLGHVPYGHDGERYLNSLCEESTCGLFVHNAQSVRTLTKLENNGRGLNLTIQVLDGILCHNGELLEEEYTPDKTKTADQVVEEYERCFSEKGFSRSLKPMTLEGCVVRISDIIAYIGRDVEDAILLGMLERKEVPEEITSVLGDRNDRIVQTLSYDLIEQSAGKSWIRFSPDIFRALRKLMEYNYKNIYLNPDKKTEDEKIKKMFRYLYQAFLKELETEDENSYIHRWVTRKMVPEYRKETSSERIAVDYIANMTDRYFNEEFRRRVIPENFGFKF